MTTEITFIDPRESPEWGAFAAERPGASVFHSTAWSHVLTDSYRYRPSYLIARQEGEVIGGVPLMVVKSLLTTKRLVSLPFSDMCAPLLPEGELADEMLLALREEADWSGAKGLELRGGTEFGLEAIGFANGTSFLNHVIDLDDEMEGRLHSSAKRAIRKAEKEGVTVRAGESLADTRAFYELMVLTRRKHGLLPQPWRFFQNIHRHFLEDGSGRLLLAEKDGRVIAGDLLLGFRDQLVYKFNASDPAHLQLRPNNLLLWHAMQFGLANGYKMLDLGRCDEDNEGLRRFKLLWGSREDRVAYYYYPGAARGRKVILAVQPARSALSLFVKYAPAFALEGMGAALYANFG